LLLWLVWLPLKESCWCEPSRALLTLAADASEWDPEMTGLT
jgi:hypothetical protein